MTPTKAARTPGSDNINISDVVAVQRHFLNLGTPLSGCKLTAADVNGDSSVDTGDVIAIQRFSLGFTTGIANTGNYKFTPANRVYTAIVTNQTAQNYDTLVFGDIASAFVENATGDGETVGEVPATVAAIALPKVALDQSKGDFIAAVTTSAIDAKNKLVGFQGDFTFDERVITFQNQPVQKARITGGNWNVSGECSAWSGTNSDAADLGLSNDSRRSRVGTLFELRMTRVMRQHKRAIGSGPRHRTTSLS